MKITIIWRYLVGIDVSKNLLDIYLLDRKTGMGHECQVSNNPKGFARLARWLAEHEAEKSQTKLISEHTGRYGEHLLRWTTDNDWTHAVENTTALDKVGHDHHRKGDRYDACELADYGRRFSDQLRLGEAPKPAVGQIKRLQAERRKMVDRRAALKAKLGEAGTHDADMQPITEMWEQQIALLDEHIDELEQRIRGQSSSDPALDPRKISSRFGFAPHSYGSGTSVSSPDRSTGHGKAEMRRLMHQAARSVATHHPHYRAYYNRKLAEKDSELLVINNIINKLIRLYCAMWNNRAEYDPNYIQKNKHRWKKSA